MRHCSATELLEDAPDRGFPADYLYSRLKGRRARLVSDWDALVASTSPLEQLPVGHFQRTLGESNPEDVWRALLLEYGWVYHQMNRKLRMTFASFFLYAELRTIITCLRYLRELRRDRVRQMVTASILSHEIKKILSSGDDAFAAAQVIETEFRRLSDDFAGTAESMRKEGLRDFEQKLVERYLSFVAAAGTDPLMRAFFRRLIDGRNMLALAKLLRVGSTTGHSFIPGGTINASRIHEILASSNTLAADKVFRELTGEAISVLELRRIEASLYRSISRWLKWEGRAVPGKGPALEYLWRCSIDALNLSVLFYGQDLERDAVRAELVR